MAKKKKPKVISFNIWDDYYDDECVPRNKIQETTGFVEHDDEFTVQEQYEICQYVVDYLKTYKLPDVRISLEGDIEDDQLPVVYFKFLTHAQREALVEHLERANLSFKGIPFCFYSES